jgi:hypothetical protein
VNHVYTANHVAVEKTCKHVEETIVQEVKASYASVLTKYNSATNAVSNATQIPLQRDQAKQVFAEVLKEQEAHDRRHCSVVVFGLHEEKGTEADLKAMRKIIEEELHIDEVTISDAYRLGRPHANEQDSTKLRPLLVRFKDSSTRQLVLRRAPRLKALFEKSGQKVYIRPDMSPLERQSHKRMMDKVREIRQAKPSSRVYIKAGKIVCDGHEWSENEPAAGDD